MTVVVSPGYLPKLDGMPLLLKTLLKTQNQEKASWYQSGSFILSSQISQCQKVLYVILQGAGVGQYSTVLFCCESFMFDKIATGLARCVPWYSIDTSVMEITNHFLIEFKVYSIRYAPSLISLTRPNTHCHPGHRPYGRRSTIILLDNSDKLTPSSYLHIHRLVFQSSLEKLIFCSR